MSAAEDTLFCLNASKITRVWFVPEAICYHAFREEWGKYLRNQIMLGRYIIIYRRQYFNTWYDKGVWPVVFLGGLMAWAYGFLQGCFLEIVHSE